MLTIHVIHTTPLDWPQIGLWLVTQGPSKWHTWPAATKEKSRLKKFLI